MLNLVAPDSLRTLDSEYVRLTGDIATLHRDARARIDSTWIFLTLRDE